MFLKSYIYLILKRYFFWFSDPLADRSVPSLALRMLARIIALMLIAVPAAAQTGRPPATFSDCSKLYESELKKAAVQTGKNLRETQRLAGLHLIRCERAVERKLVMDRAKGANRAGR
jgi:hypothetical protein